MTPPPLVTIRYKNGSFDVAYGVRTEGDPNGEAGLDEIMGGLAIAVGIVMSRVAYMDPDYLDSEPMQKTKDAFWSQVQGTIDKALTGEVKRG